MTLTIKQIKIGNKYIEISQDKYSSAYKVTLSHTYSDDLYYIDNQNIYSTLKAANNRFNYLKRTIQN